MPNPLPGNICTFKWQPLGSEEKPCPRDFCPPRSLFRDINLVAEPRPSEVFGTRSGPQWQTLPRISPDQRSGRGVPRGGVRTLEGPPHGNYRKRPISLFCAKNWISRPETFQIARDSRLGFRNKKIPATQTCSLGQCSCLKVVQNKPRESRRTSPSPERLETT